MAIHDMRRLVFVDTSEYVSANYEFDGNRLASLASRAIKEQITLAMSTIVHGEIRTQIERGIDDARSSLEKMRGQARILKGLRSTVSRFLFEDIDFDEIKKQKLSQFDAFVENARVQIVGLHEVDSDAVFERYFSGKAPFHSGKKKCEFPDAFSLAAISAWGESECTDVLVASSDGDIEHATSCFSNLVYVGRLQALLERIAVEFDTLAPAAIQAVSSLLPLLRADLVLHLQDAKARMTNWPGRAHIQTVLGCTIDPTLLRVETESDGRARADFDVFSTGRFDVSFEYHDLDHERALTYRKHSLPMPTKMQLGVRQEFWQSDLSVYFNPATPTEDVIYQADWHVPNEIDMRFDGPE